MKWRGFMMSAFLTLCGVASWAFAAYAWFFSASDIQLGIVVTAAIGGAILIGLGQLGEQINRLLDRDR